jgi:hypothetical protein
MLTESNKNEKDSNSKNNEVSKNLINSEIDLNAPSTAQIVWDSENFSIT